MHETLILRGRAPSSHPTGTKSSFADLPPDLVLQAAKRLRIIALIFSGTFFMANFVAQVPDYVAGDFAFFSKFVHWGPGAISILMGLVMFFLATGSKLPLPILMRAGLLFQVAGSYGIAFSETWGVYPDLAYEPEHLRIAGLSWVAVWILAYTVIVPNKPKHALLAALGSAMAYPAILRLSMAYGSTSLVFTPAQFFFAIIFPYLLVVVIAYVASRVIYKLGAAVTKARELGSYRLTELLGKGGMGEVWRADHRMLARTAAIKLLRPEALGGSGFGAEVILKRFEREAQATATMKSPHTIQLFDFGVSTDGSFYYVMELLDGFDLDSLIKRVGPIEPSRTIHILRQACHSLAEAHEKGLIHRDIKPANIYVCRYGRDVDFVKVLDFGLVKHRREPAAEDPRLTAENTTSGTPAFMAPEQILGNLPIDGRTDIYALGCVAYWLLTGQMVFEGASPMELMMHHAKTAPVPPSRRTETHIPADLEAVILACLEKDPGRRPRSADDLARRIDACAAAGGWNAESARSWWQTHRPAAARVDHAGAGAAGAFGEAERLPIP